jgi:hypothetical protein
MRSLELRRRNVYRAAMFYAAAGWLFVQIATQVFPIFEIPTWVVRLIVVVGFPESYTSPGSALGLLNSDDLLDDKSGPCA